MNDSRTGILFPYGQDIFLALKESTQILVRPRPLLYWYRYLSPARKRGYRMQLTNLLLPLLALKMFGAVSPLPFMTFRLIKHMDKFTFPW